MACGLFCREDARRADIEEMGDRRRAEIIYLAGCVHLIGIILRATTCPCLVATMRSSFL